MSLAQTMSDARYSNCNTFLMSNLYYNTKVLQDLQKNAEIPPFYAAKFPEEVFAEFIL